MIEKLAKKKLKKIVPYRPGKPIEELAKEYGVKKIIKLASNESPLSPSAAVTEAIKKEIQNINLYPEGSGPKLRSAIADYWKMKPENIILGNGSNEIIEFIIHAFLNEKEQVISAWPSFLVYFLAVEALCGEIIEVPLKYYHYDLEAILKKITDKTKLIFIASPNNPTGTSVDKDSLDSFMKKVPKNIIIVFDEAYAEFADPKVYPDTTKYVKDGKPVIVLRTFSKIYGLAGLRIGYGIAQEEAITLLNKVRQPFNVSRIAQVAALAALGDNEYRCHILNMVNEGKRYLYNEFYKMELFYVPSDANFVLVNIGDSKKIFNKLLKKGVIVREMTEYDLPEFIRVTVGTMHQNRIFIKALKEVL